MKRRSFFQIVGGFFAGAGGARALGGDGVEQEDVRKILITSGEYPLAQTLADGLGAGFDVHLTARTDVETKRKFTRSALDHEAGTDELIRDMDAIVHVTRPEVSATANEQIDYHTRCTYNLLFAAANAGVRKVVLLSSLDLLTSYDEDFDVNEDWRPIPSSRPELLSTHLAEYTCREFAREAKLDIVVLRLGKVVRADDVKGRPFDPLWVEERDVTQAVSRALLTNLHDGSFRIRRWMIFHIQSASPKARFSIGRAKGSLGYHPQFFADAK